MEHTVVITRFIICSQLFVMIYGHARLLSPPSRASKWRFGFSMPAADYDDNQGYCGGRSRLWNEFGGKCGVCGDAFFPIPRAHERGGRYYTGEITKEFKQGEIIEADVEVTANHRGFFEFKICPYDNPEREDVERDQNGKFVEVTQRCLDKHPIPLADGSGYQYTLPSPFRRGIHTVKLRLPFNLVCQRCLFQWKYNTGNSWGKSHNGSDCMGCGHQEQFYSCADVKISRAAHMGPRPPSTMPPQPSETTQAWDRSEAPSFWTRIPGVPGWRQNPAFSTTTTTTTTTPKPPTPKPRLLPWWFFDKDSGWFNRDELTPSTPPPPTRAPSDIWDDWTVRPRTTRMPFWNRWFVGTSTESSPPNVPLVPEGGNPKVKSRKSGFWEHLFSKVRQNFWTWFFKGRHPGLRKTGRHQRPKQTRRTTTTTTTMAPRTTSPWWKWWENDRSKTTTTPAPKYRSWWDSYPWARVWDTISDGKKERTTPRYRARWQQRSSTRTTTPTTRSPWSTARRVEWEDNGQQNYNNNDNNNNNNNYNNNNNNNNNNRHNGGNNHHHSNIANNEEREDDYTGSSEVAQTSLGCYPVGIWTSLPGMKQWCVMNCAAGFCPEGYCSEGCRD